MSAAVITCGESTEGEFDLRLRCPPWSEAIAVDSTQSQDDGSIVIRRHWRPGMTVRVSFETRRGLEVREGGAGITIGSAGNPVGAVRSGPWVFAMREEEMGEFGLRPESIAVEVAEADDVSRTCLRLPANADRLIAVHSNAALSPGSAGLSFQIYLDGALVYDSGTYKAESFSNFVEAPLGGARTVSLEIRSPGSDVAVASGRWRDVRIITGDGNITFLDGAFKAGGGQCASAGPSTGSAGGRRSDPWPTALSKP